MKAAVLLLAFAASAVSQNGASHGTVQRIQVHGKTLEGNLEGDSPDRDVAVYLPPGYNSSPTRRYPVLYLLHGFTDNVENWWGAKPHFVKVPAAVDKALGAGAREMIVVMPDAFTRYQGSMYSNSATTGDWEDFVASELVAYIDAHYRTIPRAAARGLAGHSMGGYGAIRIGMKHPEVYSSLYLLSPCCMAPGGERPNPKAEAIRDPSEVAKADFFTKATFASAAAWSPNPKNPPLFIDLPWKDGVVQPDILAKWTANAPLAMVDQYIANLKRYHAIGMDVGDKDETIAPTVRRLDEILNRYGIGHVFEIYDGNHVNRIADRLETKILPFFSTALEFQR